MGQADADEADAAFIDTLRERAQEAFPLMLNLPALASTLTQPYRSPR